MIQAGNIEAGLAAAWNGWLSSFFDGGSHSVSGRTEVFPAATLKFGVPVLSEPGLYIVVQSEMDSGRSFLGQDDEGGAVVNQIEGYRWRMLVQAAVARAALTGANAGNAEYLCRRAADLLHGLLSDASATVTLAQQGIAHVRVMGDLVVPGTQYAVREIRVRGDVLYDS